MMATANGAWRVQLVSAPALTIASNATGSVFPGNASRRPRQYSDASLVATALTCFCRSVMSLIPCPMYLRRGRCQADLFLVGFLLVVQQALLQLFQVIRVLQRHFLAAI